MKITDFTKATPIVAKVLGPSVPGSALDIGAENGRNTLYLAKKGWRVDAVDIDAKAIATIDVAASDNKLDIDTYTTNISEFKTDKSYDAIICLMTLHFMDHTTITTTIDWIKKHVNPEGTVIVSGFTDANAPGTRPYLFKRDELKDHFPTWKALVYEENEKSSISHPDTQQIVTYYVTRLAVQKPSNEN